MLVIAAGALLAIPVIGQVQQVPGESTRRPSTIPELQELMKAQTEAIQALHARVVTLETRVKKLEDERASGTPR
jgi:polyhydroxyalkanoate synthesis regulator phasin